jgi:hypothetical protein
MVAVSVLFIWLVYGLLGLAFVRALRAWYQAPAGSGRWRPGLQAILWACLIGGVSYRQQAVQRAAEKEYIGAYPLTHYPQCPACVLYLQADNQYEVRQGSHIRERGPWRYESGADYWIVYLNDKVQLASGKYRYASH